MKTKNFIIPFVSYIMLTCHILSAQQTPISYGDNIDSTLINPTSIHQFSFEAESGDLAIIRASSPTSAIDPKLEILDPEGNSLQQDFSSFGNEVRLDVNISATGSYIILFQDNGSDGNGDYNLSLQKSLCPPVNTSFICSMSFNETLPSPTTMDAYTFEVDQPGSFRVVMSSNSSAIDPRIELYNLDGLLEEAFNSFGNVAQIDVSLTAGTFTLLAMDNGADGTANYDLSILGITGTCGTPDCSNPPTPEICNNNIDDDNDNLTDCEDPDCGFSTPVIANVTQNGIFCSDETINLSINDPGTYNWSGPIDFSSDQQTPEISSATVLMSGTYFITVTNANECQDSSSVEIIVNPVPTISNVSPTNPTPPDFNNGQIIVEASGENLEFSINAGNSYQSSNNFNDLEAGVYNISVQNAETGCFAEYDNNSVELVEEGVPCLAPPFQWLNRPESACPGSEVILGVAGSDINFNYQLFQDDMAIGDPIGGNSGNINFAPVVLNQTSTFSVSLSLKSDGACIFDIEDALEIGIGELSILVTDSTPESGINNDGRVDLCIENGTLPFIYSFNPERGQITEPLQPCQGNVQITGLRAGFYEFNAEDATGCLGTLVFQIENPDKRRIGFPEKPLLTPNNDQQNDQLVFDGLFEAPDNNELIIYDRYGSIILQNAPYNNDWDCTYNGKPVPNGTYFYTLKVFEGEQEVYTGFITIIR